MDTIELRWELMDNGRYACYDDEAIIMWVYEEEKGCWCWEDYEGFSDGWYDSAERAMQVSERSLLVWYQPEMVYIEEGRAMAFWDLDFIEED